MSIKKLREGRCGEGIGRGMAGFPSLKGPESDREPASAQQFCGLGLADIVPVRAIFTRWFAAC